MTKLALGPIVGHTDTTTSCVWVQTHGPSDEAELRVEGAGTVQFVPTDSDGDEFRTAIARIEGLEPDTRYAYEVWVGGEACAKGSFRTMPVAADEVTFFSLSCNDGKGIGAWDLLAKAIESEDSSFILMLGDQVYLDMPDEDLWTRHLHSAPAVRRRAIAAKYCEVWSRQPAATIMANVPTYMVWEDHDIRDGWGSSAGDSPTLAARYPRGKRIFEQYRAFFDDARDVYYHFQACRNPSGASVLDGAAAPFSFDCMALRVVVLDERTERDFMRPKNPVLGDAQWRFLHDAVEGLDASVQAIVVANGIPIVDLDPKSITHRMFHDRKDDIEPFSRGDAELLETRRTKITPRPLEAIAAGLGTTVDKDFRFARLLHIAAEDIDDARDRWSYATNRDEQVRLLHLFAKAAAPDAGRPERGLVFLGGDIHVGALFDIEFSELGLSAQNLVSSGISQTPPPMVEVRGAVLDTDFEVTEGIRAKLAHLVGEPNFGVTRVRFEKDRPARITNGFGHRSADE
jgi:phosphodiesterase/alkaline phosphatase D-like protein